MVQYSNNVPFSPLKMQKVLSNVGLYASVGTKRARSPISTKLPPPHPRHLVSEKRADSMFGQTVVFIRRFWATQQMIQQEDELMLEGREMETRWHVARCTLCLITEIWKYKNGATGNWREDIREILLSEWLVMREKEGASQDEVL